MLNPEKVRLLNQCRRMFYSSMLMVTESLRVEVALMGWVAVITT